MKKISFFVSSFLFLAITSVIFFSTVTTEVFAQFGETEFGSGGDTGSTGAGVTGTTGTTGSGVTGSTGTSGGNAGGTKLANPLKVNTIQELLNLILQVVVTLAVPIIVLFIIYSGFLYVTAQGKPEAIKKATTAFTWTIIGGVIVLGASLLLTIITNTVNALR